MTDLKVLPTRQWATSEEAAKVAKGLLESAERGEIVSLAYVAERKDDLFESGSTKVHNAFGCAGYLMSMAMRLMGFEDTRNKTVL